MADFRTVQPGDPAWLVEFFKVYGLAEGKGAKNNPLVVALYAEAGFSGIKEDSVAWCAAAEGAMLIRGGYRASGSLLARSYLDYGEEIAVGDERRGDIAVFKRGNSSWMGHVANVLKIEGDRVWVIGANQSLKGTDGAVTITSMAKASLLGLRRPGREDKLSATPIAAGSKQTAPLPPASAYGKGDALTEAVQTALIGKGYPEVGRPDGLYGSKTRGAILAFEADVGLELSGKVTPELLAQVLSAEPRPAPEGRKTALPEDKSVINSANIQTGAAVVVGGAGFAKAVEPIVEQVEETSSFVGRVADAIAPLTELVTAFWPVLVIGGAAVVIYLAFQSKRAVVNDFRAGKISR